MAAALVAAALGVANQVLGKAIRDTLFLATFAVETLPYALLATAVATILAISAYTRLTGRYTTAGVVPGLGMLTAVVYGIFYVALMSGSVQAVVLLYIWVSVTGVLLVSGFWTILAERFEPRSARRLYGYVGVASTAGGLAGGLGSHAIVQIIEPEGLLIALAIGNLLLAASVIALRRSRQAEAPRPKHVKKRRAEAEPPGLWSGIRALASTPYLRDVSLLVVAITVAGTLTDYVLKDVAADSLGTKHELAAFFSLFHGAVGAVTLGLQLLFARPLVAKKGMAAALVALPIWLGMGALFLLAAPVLAAATALRGGENAFRNSFHRSGYELLFIPLTSRQRSSTKPILDTLLDRVADGAGALLILLLVAGLSLHASHLAWLILLLGVASIYMVIRVQRGYVDTLSQNLMARAVELDDLAGAVDDDATAREAIRTTLIDTDRADLRDQLGKSLAGQSLMQSLNLEALPKGIEMLRRSGRQSAQAAFTKSRNVGDPIIDLMREMLDPDPERVRNALARWDGRDRRPVALLVRLLARQEVYLDVIKVLSVNADRIAGTLADHLLDETESFAVRRRLPRVLASCRSKVAIDALAAALGDTRFEVRYYAALALTRIQQTDAAPRPDAEVVWAAIRSELKKSKPMWEAQRILDEPDHGEDARLATALQQRGAHSLQHVFHLLSLVLESRPINLAFRALYGLDTQFRGVGLEYLENVLPGDVRRALWPLIGDEEPPPLSTRKRSVEDLMRELNASQSHAAVVKPPADA